MRCLSPAEVEATFIRPKLHVSLEHAWYRAALCLDSTHTASQTRIAAEQPSNFGDIPHFVQRLNRWLPNHHARLLWVDHWETAAFEGVLESMVAATWRGIGEMRSLGEAPGLYLDAQDWEDDDQTAISSPHSEALGILVGVVTILMMTYSDGWLIADGCTDRIEFREGHFFFHSDDPQKLSLAEAIVDEFSCKRWAS